MRRSALTVQRLGGVFLAGCVLLNYPLLGLVERAAVVFGLPLVPAYLFLVWAALIAVMAWIVEGPGASDGR